MPPILSVVIPSHCRVDLLRRCLASVVLHAPAGTEILVVDDGSAEGSVSLAAREFPGVRALSRTRQLGFCRAVNAGVSATTGTIVEVLNDDTEVEAGWAEAALKVFDDPRVAAVAPLVLFADGKRIDSAGDSYYLGGVARKRLHGEPGALATGACEVFGASGSSAFYRRSMFEAVGGFPGMFGAYFEDVDLSFRLRRAGAIIRFEPASRVRHHVSASYGRKPNRRVLEQQSLNEERVFWRNLPLTALPLHAAVLLAKAWRRWEEGTLFPFALGRLRLLGELPGLVRHRRWLRTLGAMDWKQWLVERHFTLNPQPGARPTDTA